MSALRRFGYVIRSQHLQGRGNAPSKVEDVEISQDNSNQFQATTQTIIGRWWKKLGSVPKGHLDTMLWFDYCIGLSPFMVSSENQVATSLRAMVLTGLLNVICFLNILINIRYSVFLSKESGDRTVNYLNIGHQASNLLLQLRFLQVLWKKQYLMTQLIAKLKMNALPNNFGDKKIHESGLGCLIGGALRIGSFTVGLLFVVLGISGLHHKDTWSFLSVLLLHKERLKAAAFLQPENDLDNSVTNGNISLPANFTDLSTDITWIPGVIGLILATTCEVVLSCPADFYLLSCLALWRIVNNLKFDKFINEVGTPVSANKEMEKIFANRELKRYKEAVEVGKTLNKILHFFSPALTMATILQCAKFMHSAMERDWFLTLYYTFTLIKIIVAYLIAGNISERLGDFQEWITSEQVQELLMMDSVSLQLLLNQMNNMPLGIGFSAFYVDTEFMKNFLELTLTYFFLIVAAVEQKF